MATQWVLYGATGYTGQLIAEEAVRRGHRPLLAGRSAGKLSELAGRLGLPFQAVPLSDAAGLRALIDARGVVLHAAGPFVETSQPMVEACLATGTSYLDITGELQVFERIFSLDTEARARKVALIPGGGFDVVPTDCLAKFLADKVPGATRLDIAIAAIGNPSAGTAKSALGIIGEGGRVRRNGALVKWPLGKGTRRQRFLTRERWVAPAPLADLSTGFRSTGIPNITTWMAVSRQMAQPLRWSWPVQPLLQPVLGRVLSSPMVKDRVSAFLERNVQGASAEQRARSESHAWARVEGDGRVAEAWLRTIDGYDFTKIATVLAVERILRDRPIGALTPSLAFGADFTLEIPGTTRTEELPST